MLRLLRRTCIGAGGSERAHFVTFLDQQPRHILRHATGRHLRPTKKAINDEYLQSGSNLFAGHLRRPGVPGHEPFPLVRSAQPLGLILPFIRVYPRQSVACLGAVSRCLAVAKKIS